MDTRIFEGILHGLFDGLFGPALAQWMSRFKYWIIFSVTVLAVHFLLFIQDWFDNDFVSALSRSIKFIQTPAGVLAPMAIGFLAVFVVFVGSLNVTHEKTKDTESGK